MIGSLPRQAGGARIRALLGGLVSAGIVAGIATGVFITRHPHVPSAERLAQLRRSTPAGMVLVPGGPFLMGSRQRDRDPGVSELHRAWVRSFYIDRYPVTNREYARFDPKRYYPRGWDDYPVTGVTWDQANAYLRSVGKTLPTEAEWEKAARGPDGRNYPWGNRPGQWLLPTCKRRTFREVTKYPGPPSPYGAYDMVGAVWQWVRDNVQGDRDRYIIRGGATGYSLESDTTYSRGIEGPGVT